MCTLCQARKQVYSGQQSQVNAGPMRPTAVPLVTGALISCDLLASAFTSLAPKKEDGARATASPSDDEAMLPFALVLRCAGSVALSPSPGHVVSHRPAFAGAPTKPSFLAPRAAMVCMADREAEHPFILHFQRFASRLERRVELAYEEWNMRCLLESVQIELWHRSQASKGGVPPPNREWEANAAGAPPFGLGPSF